MRRLPHANRTSGDQDRQSRYRGTSLRGIAVATPGDDEDVFDVLGAKEMVDRVILKIEGEFLKS